MSLLVHLKPINEQISHVRQLLLQHIHLSTPQKVIIVSVTVSVAAVGVLARYFRRRKRTIDPTKLRSGRSYYFSSKRSRASGVRSPNGDVGSIASSSGRRSIFGRQSSAAAGAARGGSEKASIASGSIVSGDNSIEMGGGGDVVGVSGGVANLTPQQLGVMGMEALETCISYWEDALSAYRSKESQNTGGALAMLSPEEAAFCHDLQQLLELAIDLQENSEMLFLDERSVLFRPESGPNTRNNHQQFDTDLSGGESFASAQDQVADLREFEEFSDYFPDLDAYPLYQQALRQLENGGGIPCRTLRTDVVKCASDAEYLAKLHCLRLAFQQLLRDPVTYRWFVDAGRQILADLLLYADRDPKDFLIGYEEMLNYINDGSNWRELEEELSTNGVKALTFYDVVLDYILMDAFEDLDSPPSSVTAVIQNRWLSNGFKETALTTAVWSVLKAKRRKLKFPNGFMAHFYTLSAQLSPLLAWGFLGTDELLKDTCVYFKEQVMGFLIDIFNFHKCRYGSIDELATDVFNQLKTRVNNLCQRLSAQQV